MLLLLLFFITVEAGFVIMAAEVNFNPIPTEKTYCEDDSCAQYICQILSNTSLCVAFVVLMPITNTTSCPNTKYITRTNIITFVLTQEANISQPLICNRIDNCLTQGCQNFRNSSNAFMFGFTGQCY
jgi:hypothetical protein